MNDSERTACENVPDATELFTEEAFAKLGRDQALSGRIAVLRDREEKLGLLTEKTGALEANRLCQNYIVKLLDEQDEAEAVITPEDPEAFLQTIVSLPRDPLTAPRRRRVREIARIYKRRAKDEVFLPQDAEGFRQLWEIAMEGEPRWSEEFPSSAFRVKRAWIADSFLQNKMLQACCEPEDYERELTRLTALLFDSTLLPEIRAICGFIFFEWIHPFQDGNGHTGRMLVPSALAEIYQLPTIVCFAYELVMKKGRTAKELERVRSREGNLNDFCSGILAQLEDAQAEAEEILREAYAERGRMTGEQQKEQI